MLKIKDNVDLKELEKYGFIKNEYFYDSFEYSKWGVRINCQSRQISLLANASIELLYDLIKDGLVEKVD